MDLEPSGTMMIIDASDPDDPIVPDRSIRFFFDGEECSAQVLRAYVARTPDVEVEGWAEFLLFDADGHFMVLCSDGNPAFPLTAWKQGQIRWTRAT